MKSCVITLAKLHNNHLNELIDNLNVYFVNNNNVDLLIFIESHEEHLIPTVQKYIGSSVKFIPIHSFSNVKNHINVPDKVFGFGIQYRMMCRFFSGEIFELLKTMDYTHYLRLDTDSKFYESVRPIFKEFVENDFYYGYVSVLNEPPQVSNMLIYEIKNYIYDKKLKCNDFILKDHIDQLAFCYYNNFEMVKISEFTTDTYLSMYHYLNDECNGFMLHRWGDALFRYIYVNLFLPQEKIHYFSNIGYFHKFDLKNKPHVFMDWKLKEFQKQNQ